eukprot:507698-Rhodomonas_salina.1
MRTVCGGGVVVRRVGMGWCGGERVVKAGGTGGTCSRVRSTPLIPGISWCICVFEREYACCKCACVLEWLREVNRVGQMARESECVCRLVSDRGI